MISRKFTHLRKLREEDAPLMLEWMRDKNITEHLRADFGKKNEDDCLKFIRDSWNDKKHLHFAITDANDMYMGTVSLKDIAYEERTAEFGICIRSVAMGTGLAKAAMEEILSYGYTTLALNFVFWCVSAYNERANRFYRKNGYTTISQAQVPERFTKTYAQYSDNELFWYCAEKRNCNEQEES